jgi:aminopeptidase N
LELVRRLLDGAEEVPGLKVDTELRWHLLQNLVAAGAVSDEAIEAELDRDQTAAGQRHAAAARAARPNAAAKEEAWRSVVESDELPNAMQAAIIGAFQHPSQRELLKPYVEKYFAVIANIWAERTLDVAQNIVVGFYPHLLVSQDTVDRTDAYIRSEKPAAALRRLLLEGRDGVARALRAQAFDRATAGS